MANFEQLPARARGVERVGESLIAGPISRRQLIVGAGAAGSLLFLASLPEPIRLLAAARADGALSEGQRHTLRSLWDAIVPGTWESVVEDVLEDGSPAPGADDARVQEWLEQVAGALPAPLDWLAIGFLGFWANDVDLWADVVHGVPFDGQPKFWELPLDPTTAGRGRQRKLILMQALFGTLVDVKYQGGIILAKTAFFCDFYYEANDPETRVGREYIGWPLPPGYTPYQDFTYNAALGDHDDRLITVNPGRDLVAPP